MIKIKIIYNPSIIDDLKLFQNSLKLFEDDYQEDFSIQESNIKKLDLLINDKIVFTLDDNFNVAPLPTSTILKKINQQIDSCKTLKRSRQDSKFDDIGLIDF